jgi:hypothetical protein
VKNASWNHFGRASNSVSGYLWKVVAVCFADFWMDHWNHHCIVLGDYGVG